MANNPKFERKLREQIVYPDDLQRAEPGYGIIMDYNPTDNVATVLMSHPGSDQPGQFFHSVPCPTNMGVQTVAPEQGRQCWVVFKDGTMSNPMITHFFNHTFRDIDAYKNDRAVNDIPRFMLEL